MGSAQRRKVDAEAPRPRLTPEERGARMRKRIVNAASRTFLEMGYAKATVAGLVEGMGLEALDVGPIRASHVLEGMLTIWINARQAGTPYDYYFRRTETPAP